jgi:hypothetical protein
MLEETYYRWSLFLDADDWDMWCATHRMLAVRGDDASFEDIRNGKKGVLTPKLTSADWQRWCRSIRMKRVRLVINSEHEKDILDSMGEKTDAPASNNSHSHPLRILRLGVR